MIKCPMSNGDRIKFSEFQASIASFGLAEAESIITEEFALDGKLSSTLSICC